MQQLDPQEPILHLATKISWDVLEKGLKKHYNYSGPAKPIRLMVGLLILKQWYNYSDVQVVSACKRSGCEYRYDSPRKGNSYRF